MNLSFSTKWPDGSPTYFVEKIWAGLADLTEHQMATDCPIDPHVYYNASPKYHTIRKDDKGRWKPGNKIHFIINNRTPNRYQFAPILIVKSIQKFRVKWDSGFATIYIDDKIAFSNIGYLDRDRFLEYRRKGEILARNDGFESIEKFLEWFNEDFDGVMIHWTDFRYWIHIKEHEETLEKLAQ